MSFIESGKVNHRIIAKAAGVSNATVSLALRGHPRISAKTRLHVNRIASQLGYVRDPKLASLMSHVSARKGKQYTETIAYVVNDAEMLASGSGAKVNSQRFRIAEDACSDFGYRLEIFNLTRGELADTRLNDILINRGIRGVLVVKMNTREHQLQLDWDRLTPFAVGNSLHYPDLHRVVRNHFFGAVLAINKLRNIGYRRIGLAVSPIADVRNNHQWLNGYLSAVFNDKTLGWIPPFINEFEGAEFRNWLRDHDPEVVLSNSDQVYGHLQALGLRCPRDVGFVHLHKFNSEHACAGVVECPYEMTEVAANLLIGALSRNERGIPKSARLTLVKGRWSDGPTIHRLNSKGKRKTGSAGISRGPVVSTLDDAMARSA